MSVVVQLNHFEGPLGLLLYLIKKEEMDIFDINIQEITQQYLEYIKALRDLDLELAGDFVSMAATLIHIKSRMLLPHYDEHGEEIVVEDPRKELVQRLLEYQKFQEASRRLISRPLLTRDVWVRGSREPIDTNDDQIDLEDGGLFPLISMYRLVMRRMKNSVHKVRAKVQSIASRVLELRARLIVGTRLKVAELITEEDADSRRRQLLITFLAMLELARMGFVNLFQNEVYSDIHVESLKIIETDVLARVQEFDSADAEAVAERLVSVAGNPDGEPLKTVSMDQEISDISELELGSSNQEAATDEEILLAETELV